MHKNKKKNKKPPLFACLMAGVLFLLSPCSSGLPIASKVITVQAATNIFLWTEAFGDLNKPAILLVSGAGESHTFWHDIFCKKLAKKGFYVIRYDYRDTGQSSTQNYNQHPYSVMNLTDDAVTILDAHHVKKANIVGYSMGGEVAMFMAAFYPENVASIALLGSSTSFEEGLSALEGKEVTGALSPPDANYVKWVTKSANKTNLSKEQKINEFVQQQRLLNGKKAPFNENVYRKIAEDNFSLSQLENTYAKHIEAMKASFGDHRRVMGLIKVPTLIIHGTADPVFGVDHAYSLHHHIKKSKLVNIEDMGHALNPVFYDEIIDVLKKYIKN